MPKLKAVIFDWAGTTVDYGSLAPIRALQKVFREFGIELTEPEARRDMGLPKRDHISRILNTADSSIIEPIYDRFVPLQLACLAEYSHVIEGVPNAAERLRWRGLRIGSTTGYTRAMLDLILPQSAREGFHPDCALTPEDVGAGRPHPFMIYETAVRLKIYPFSAIVKVGDTEADIHEGLNAGAWTVGVAKTGNMIGLTKPDLEALSLKDLTSRLETARIRFTAAGADFVIDSIDELDAVLDEIESRPCR